MSHQLLKDLIHKYCLRIYLLKYLNTPIKKWKNPNNILFLIATSTPSFVTHRCWSSKQFISDDGHKTTYTTHLHLKPTIQVGSFISSKFVLMFGQKHFTQKPRVPIPIFYYFLQINQIFVSFFSDTIDWETIPSLKKKKKDLTENEAEPFRSVIHYVNKNQRKSPTLPFCYFLDLISIPPMNSYSDSNT